MSATLKLQALVARRPMASSITTTTAALRRFPTRWRRSYSSAIPETLPLAGFKVLDMTRVLAGVGRETIAFSLVDQLLTTRGVPADSHTARKYWEI